MVGTLFTHHQKCVILDTQATGNNRKVSAFIGGLDLCDGRYDTPEHRLFRDLDTVFENDFHNPTFTVRSHWICLELFSKAEFISMLVRVRVIVGLLLTSCIPMVLLFAIVFWLICTVSLPWTEATVA